MRQVDVRVIEFERRIYQIRAVTGYRDDVVRRGIRRVIVLSQSSLTMSPKDMIDALYKRIISR